MKKILTILLFSVTILSKSHAQVPLDKHDIAKIKFLTEKTITKFHLNTDQQDKIKTIFEERFLAYKNDWASIKKSGDDVGAAAKGKEISIKYATAAISVIKCTGKEYWDFIKEVEPEMKTIKG